jgi:hypothetical protein
MQEIFYYLQTVNNIVDKVLKWQNVVHVESLMWKEQINNTDMLYFSKIFSFSFITL